MTCLVNVDGSKVLKRFDRHNCCVFVFLSEEHRVEIQNYINVDEKLYDERNDATDLCLVVLATPIEIKRN